MRPAGGSLVELRVWGVDRVAPAVVRMGTHRLALRRTPGLAFAKLLGTGSGRSFTMGDADPHHWALLTVWEDSAAADAFEAGPVVRAWRGAGPEELRVRMVPTHARGRWSRTEPFDVGAVPVDHDGRVAAITRARLRPTRAREFWRAVPPVSEDLSRVPGLRVSLGLGEAPLGWQGTFSLWDSATDLVDFAYRRPVHREVVTRTPEAGWYAEELFARFAVLSVSGRYQGRTP